MMSEHICRHCGKTFKGHSCCPNVYCSLACRVEFVKAHHPQKTGRILTCPQCKQEFYCNKRRNKVFCTKRCLSAFHQQNHPRRNLVTNTCACCGTSFTVKPGRANSARCCSHSCATRMRTPEQRAKGVKTRKLHSHKKNYARINRQSEHRVIMAGLIGRELLRSEVVHHINGVRGDNRIENLMLMTSSDHAKLHAFIRLTNEGKSHAPTSVSK